VGPAAAVPSPDAAALPPVGPGEAAAAASPSISDTQDAAPLQNGTSLPDGAAAAAAAGADTALNTGVVTNAPVDSTQQQAIAAGVTGDAAAAVTPSAPSPVAESSPEPRPLEQQQQSNPDSTELMLSSNQLHVSASEVPAGQQVYVSLDLSSLGGLAGGRAVKFNVVRSNTPVNSNDNNKLVNSGGAGSANNNNADAGSAAAGAVCIPDATSTSSAGITGTACRFAQAGSYAVAVSVDGAVPQPLLSSTVTVLPDPAAPAPSPGECRLTICDIVCHC
jgi:hypothetical protein